MKITLHAGNVLFAAVALITASLGSTGAAAVSGCVVDIDGNRRPNVTVDLHYGGGATKTVLTNSEGYFTFDGPKPSPYNIYEGSSPSKTKGPPGPPTRVSAYNLPTAIFRPGGTRIKDRGSYGEAAVSKDGKVVTNTPSGCIQLSGSWYIAARVIGKDEEGHSKHHFLRLKLTATSPVSESEVKASHSDGLVIFEWLYADGQEYKITLHTEPDEAKCEYENKDNNKINASLPGAIEYMGTSRVGFPYYVGYTIICTTDRTMALRKSLRTRYKLATEGRDAYYTAVLGLRICGESKARSDREAVCGRAVKDVADCNVFRDNWDKDRALLLGGGGSKEDRAEFATLTMPPCPTVIEASGLTPPAQLEQWAKEETEAPTALSRKGRGGADLIEAGIRAAQQDERDRPARLAREKAEAARAASEEARRRTEQWERERQAAREQAAENERSRAAMIEAFKGLADTIANKYKAKETAKEKAKGGGDTIWRTN